METGSHMPPDGRWEQACVRASLAVMGARAGSSPVQVGTLPLKFYSHSKNEECFWDVTFNYWVIFHCLKKTKFSHLSPS